MIENNVNQKERLEKLNSIAKKQMKILVNDKNIVGLNKYDNKQKLIKEDNNSVYYNIDLSDK